MEKGKAGRVILKRLTYLVDRMTDDYLIGPTLGVADCYLFVMLLWAGNHDVAIPPELAAYRERIMALPSTRKAMTHEGLI